MHIGPPKTGTTTIQQFLWDNRAALAERGIRYDMRRNSAGPQSYLLHACYHLIDYMPDGVMANRPQFRSREARRAYAEKILTELAAWPSRFDEPVAVFSSEHFAVGLHSASAVRSFDAMFRQTFDDVHYVAYVREPVARARSIYSERLKAGDTGTDFTEFVSTTPYVLAQAIDLRRWMAGVGSENLTVRLMDPAALTDGDLIHDFCDFLGTSPEGLAVPAPQNQSLTHAEVEGLHRLNHVLMHMPKETAPIFKNQMKLRQMFRDAAPPGPSFSLTRSEIRHAWQATARDRLRLRLTFFPRRARLFSHRERPRDDASGAARDTALDILSTLARQLETDGDPMAAICRRALDDATVVS